MVISDNGDFVGGMQLLFHMTGAKLGAVTGFKSANLPSWQVQTDSSPKS